MFVSEGPRKLEKKPYPPSTISISSKSASNPILYKIPRLNIVTCPANGDLLTGGVKVMNYKRVVGVRTSVCVGLMIDYKPFVIGRIIEDFFNKVWSNITLPCYYDALIFFIYLSVDHRKLTLKQELPSC